MDISQPQKITREKSLAGLAKPSKDKRIVDLENSLYGIRYTAKKLQKMNPELLLHEAMDKAWKDYRARKELDAHIENFKKIERIEIPGTTVLMPPFDFENDHVRVWFNERILDLRKNNSNLTYRQFLKMIAEKIECHNGIAEHIVDEEFLSIFEGKITAMAPDLWDLEEFDWDDPDYGKKKSI